MAWTFLTGTDPRRKQLVERFFGTGGTRHRPGKEEGELGEGWVFWEK